MTGVSHILGISYTQSPSMHQFLAGFCRFVCRIQSVFSSIEVTAESGQLNFRTEIVFLRRFFGSIQDCVSEILSIIKKHDTNLLWQSAAIFKYTARLVHNVSSQRDRKKRGNIRLPFLGVDREGHGQGHARMCELRWGLTFLMEYLSWKYSM